MPSFSKVTHSCTDRSFYSLTVVNERLAMADIEEATVIFKKSNLKAKWLSKEDLSLLQLAEKSGLVPDFGCRSGMCGTCEVRLLKGMVNGPEGDGPNSILICSSQPASIEVELDL